MPTDKQIEAATDALIDEHDDKEVCDRAVWRSMAEVALEAALSAQDGAVGVKATMQTMERRGAIERIAAIIAEDAIPEYQAEAIATAIVDRDVLPSPAQEAGAEPVGYQPLCEKWRGNIFENEADAAERARIFGGGYRALYASPPLDRGDEWGKLAVNALCAVTYHDERDLDIAVDAIRAAAKGDGQ